MNSKKPINYPDYLSLSTILNAQHLESEKHSQPAHDEMLFIIIHQTFELWFKQFLFELESVLKLFEQPHLQDEDMNIVVSRCNRILEIQKLMIKQFDVLETMSPMEFLAFRDFLIPASGFQSLQFKTIEKRLGITMPAEHMKYSLSVLDEDAKKNLMKPEHNLLTGVSNWLERNPFLNMSGYSFEEDYQKSVHAFMQGEIETIRNHPMIDKDKVDAEIEKMKVFQKNIELIFDEKAYNAEMKDGKKKLSRKAFLSALFIRLYRHFAILQMPYQILDLLIDMNEHHVLWKQKHLLIIQRMIGMKMGTGGTSGKSFLENTIRLSNIFSDLIEMPSYMIARKHVPQLPPEVTKKLGYTFS